MSTPDARIEALERELAESRAKLERQREYHEGTRVTEHRYEDRIDEVMRELAAALEENERLRLMLPVVGATVMPPGAHERLVAELADARALLREAAEAIDENIPMGEGSLLKARWRAWRDASLASQPPSVSGGAGPPLPPSDSRSSVREEAGRLVGAARETHAGPPPSDSLEPATPPTTGEDKDK